jgi:hypothetical protein
MGLSRYSDDFYAARVNDRVTRGVKSAFEYNDKVAKAPVRDQKVHESLDPKGVKIREARDSIAHPESLNIMFMLDVTGSMRRVPFKVQEQLPKLMGKINTVSKVEHPQILFGAVGDEFSDRGSLQVGQFESGIEMDVDISNFWLEGGGGGTNEESYQNAIFFASRNTVADALEKRGKKGYCNTPDAPIWMADQTFKPIGEVEVGDKVMGWERLNGHRSLVVTTVEAIQKRKARNVVQVTMESGRVIKCTLDHQWLSGHHGKGEGCNDIFTSVVNRYGKGALLSHVIDPIKPLSSKMNKAAFWLAGIYDGEGSSNSIAQDQEHNPEVCKRIEETLKALKFDFKYRKDSYFLLGGLQTYVKILSLPITRRKQLLDLIFHSKWSKYEHKDMREPVFSRTGDRVLHIKQLPTQEVVSMQTTTHNYVAWGYASSNCFITGDERPYSKVTAESIERICGSAPQGGDIPIGTIVKECSEKYHIFFIFPTHADNSSNPAIRKVWTDLLGPEHVIFLEDENDICDTVALAIGLCEGTADLLEAEVPTDVKRSLTGLSNSLGKKASTPKVIRL